VNSCIKPPFSLVLGEIMVKAYPSCIGGYERCSIVQVEKCPYESYCKQLMYIGMAEKVKVLKALGNPIFGKPIVSVKGWKAKSDELLAEIFINGKRFVAKSIEEVNDILRWFKP